MAEYNPSKIIKDGNTYNFRDTTKIPLAGSNQISGDLIPSTDGTVNLGGSNYQWNNAYIKSLTINGVACGDILTYNASEFVKVTGNQTIGGIKTFSNDIRISKTSPFCNVFSSGYIKGQAPTSNIYSGVRFFDDINSGSTNTITGGFEVEYNRDGYNKSYIASRNYAGENHKFFTVGLRVPNDDIRSIDFLPSVSNIVNLGSPTNKWKSFNGINPGALSLPGDYVNVDTTNWALDGTPNTFTPTNDGWLGVQGTDTVYDQTHYVFIGRTGGGSFYYQQNTASPVSAPWDGIYHGCIFIPVIKDMIYHIRCICSGINARFYSCRGNI